jgi:hypothetical protein
MANEKETAKRYVVLKNFAYADNEGNKIVVNKFKKDSGGMWIVDKEKGFKIPNVVSGLPVATVKKMKKVKALEEIDE